MRDLIEKAKQESEAKWGGWTPALEEAIRAGLQDGDRIGLGGKMVAHIHGDEVAIVEDGKETRRALIDILSDAQRERMLILKGVQAGRVTHSTGRM